ncbi:hypothetical protein CROQUDRAFT_95769 [Cronartium quercuum f. sp. fusiforme G11]|uniref:Uncharacterized protein n=1 Tax=Cronartium quercuum f. sp. fusiforme G11 TaxID=708437 RepID=A0A9P6NHP0_9BASI|nr:hypothetical protein CROQUDRAFT_95769 [Cronartium quercuum f. sp. fusiforme G11]
MDPDWSSQVFHLLPATNRIAPARRASAPDQTLASIHTSRSPRVIPRRTASDAAVLPYSACRVIQPSLYLPRKGLKPFDQKKSTPPFTPDTSLRSPFSGVHSLNVIPKTRVQASERLEESHLSQPRRYEDHQEERFRTNTSIYQNEGMVRSWVCDNNQAVESILQAIDSEIESNLSFSVDRMSLALFNFGSSPSRPRIAPNKDLELTRRHLTPIPSEPLSTPSVTLDEITSLNNEEYGRNHQSQDSEAIVPLKPSVSGTSKHVFQHGTTSKPCTSSIIRAQELRQKREYQRPRLWDRKPKGLTLDLGSLSPSIPYNTTYLQTHSYCDENSHELEIETTKNRSYPIPQAPGSTNPFEEYPFPRMDSVNFGDLDQMNSPVPKYMTYAKFRSIQRWLSEISSF